VAFLCGSSLCSLCFRLLGLVTRRKHEKPCRLTTSRKVETRSSRGNAASYRCLRAFARRRPCRRGPQGLPWAAHSIRRGSARADASPLRTQRRATLRRDRISPQETRIEGAPPKLPNVVPADRRTRGASRSRAPVRSVPRRSAQGMPDCDGAHTSGKRGRGPCGQCRPLRFSRLMAYAEFTDREGRSWRVWHTLPLADLLTTLPQDWREGWLTFESEEVKRRLAPVPSGWEQLPAARLELLCQMAQPVPQSSPIYSPLPREEDRPK
jgi:hypothetical protein